MIGIYNKSKEEGTKVLWVITSTLEDILLNYNAFRRDIFASVDTSPC